MESIFKKKIHVKCPVCSDIIEPKDYGRHMNQNHRIYVVANWKKCNQCTIIEEPPYFPTHYKLEQHKRMVHSENKELCSRCYQTFKSTFLLHCHARNEHPDLDIPKTLNCTECSEADLLNRPPFLSRLELHIHMNVKHTAFVQQNWHLCTFCLDEYFADPKELRDHINDYHEEKAAKDDAKPPEILELEDDDVFIEVMPTSSNSSSPKTAKKVKQRQSSTSVYEKFVISCPHCKNYSAERWSDVEKHIAIKHPDKKKPQTKVSYHNNSYYSCPFCTMQIACVTKNALDLHISFNHGERKIVPISESNEPQKYQLSCPVSACTKKFKGQHEIDAHVLLNHKEIRYSCTNCHRIFTDKGVLILHLKLVHDIVKPDLRLPLVNTSKELVGYIDIKNVQAKQNQIEAPKIPKTRQTGKTEEKKSDSESDPDDDISIRFEPEPLEDDDILEKIDDMIEEIDNESDDDDKAKKSLKRSVETSVPVMPSSSSLIRPSVSKLTVRQPNSEPIRIIQPLPLSSNYGPNVQAKQNQIETRETEEKKSDDDILDDDDIFGKLDDMIEKIDNESSDDDGIEIIGESNDFKIQSSTSPKISEAEKSDEKIQIVESPSTAQDKLTEVFVECDDFGSNANDPDYDPFGVDPNDVGLKLVQQVDHHDNIAVSDDSDDDIIEEPAENPFGISEVRTVINNEDLGTPVLQQSDLILACDECFEIFTSKFALSQHMIKVHPKVMVKDPSRYDHILVPTRKIDNVRVICNLCSGVIYQQEIPRHFSQCHQDFCEVKQWIKKGSDYFPDEKSLEEHKNVDKSLKRSLPTPVPILPKPVMTRPNIIRPSAPKWTTRQPNSEPIRIIQPSASTSINRPNIPKYTGVGSNIQTGAPRIVIRAAPPVQANQSGGPPPTKIIRLGQVRPMTKISFPIPAEYKIGKSTKRKW